VTRPETLRSELRVRILLVNTLYPTPRRPRVVGGAEKVVRVLAEALAAEGHVLAVLRSHPRDEPATEETVNGVRVCSLPTRNIYWPFPGEQSAPPALAATPRLAPLAKLVWHWRDDGGRSPRGLSELVQELSPEVVHTHNLTGLSPHIWRLAAALTIPIVHTLHDYQLLCPRTLRFRAGAVCRRPCLDCRMLTRRRRRASRLVSIVVGVSRAILDVHVRAGLFAGARKEVVHNAVPAVTKPAPHAAAGSRIVFGFLGRVTVEKGALDLAEALCRVPSDCTLLFAGEAAPDIRAAIEARAGGRAHFLGFVDSDAFFAAVDVVVVPSLWDEPFSLVVREAAVRGKPVICTSRGGLPEALGAHRPAWTYDPAQPDALAAIMAEVAAAPASIATAPRAPIGGGIDDMVARHVALYEQAGADHG
jgi:glycosyltransferase involved in cell wall biosynthesis